MTQKRLNFKAKRTKIRYAPQVEILADTLYIQVWCLQTSIPVYITGIYKTMKIIRAGSHLSIVVFSWECINAVVTSRHWSVSRFIKAIEDFYVFTWLHLNAIETPAFQNGELRKFLKVIQTGNALLGFHNRLKFCQLLSCLDEVWYSEKKLSIAKYKSYEDSGIQTTK